MIIDNRYDRWKLSMAVIVTIPEDWFPYNRWESPDRRTHTIAVIVTIVAIPVLWSIWLAIVTIAALVVSINLLRSLTIVHDRYNRRDRLWFYPSDCDRCDRWQSLESLAIALAKSKFGFYMIVTIAEQFASDPSDCER